MEISTSRTKTALARATKFVLGQHRNRNHNSKIAGTSSSGEIMISVRPYGFNIEDRIITQDEINIAYKKAIEDAKRI